jgi:hypothetical protein
MAKKILLISVTLFLNASPDTGGIKIEVILEEWLELTIS